MNIFPLYLYEIGDRWIVTNNIWAIAEVCRPGLNFDWFRRSSFYYNTPREGETFLKNVTRIKMGESFQIELNGRIKKISEDALFSRANEVNVLTKSRLLGMIQTSLDDYFEFVKSLVPDKVYVGNSGGFDSRLMRCLLHRHQINNEPYTIIRKRGFLKSSTELAARSVDRLYGDGRYFYIDEKDDLSYNLDLQWNPLGTAEGGKVPNELLKEILSKSIRPVSFCGGNGFLIGYNRTVWKDLITSKDYIKSFQEGFAYKNIYGLRQNRLREYGKVNFMDDFDLLDESNKSVRSLGLQKTRHFQSKYLNIHSSTGGYESLLFQAFPIYMYYPSLLQVIQSASDDLLLNRGLLEQLLLEIDPRLNFRGQDGKKPMTQKTLIDRIWLKTRGTGINNIKFLQSNRKYAFTNKEFIDELRFLLPESDSIDAYQKLKKFDKIISKYDAINQ